jgi:hypothetical protein
VKSWMNYWNVLVVLPGWRKQNTQVGIST